MLPHLHMRHQQLQLYFLPGVQACLAFISPNCINPVPCTITRRCHVLFHAQPGNVVQCNAGLHDVMQRQVAEAGSVE